MAKKYIDADRLIEGLKELEAVVYSGQLLGQSMDRYDRGQLRAINNMKELVNSLQQEQHCEDLDADITAYLNTRYSDRFKDSKIVDFTTTEAFELALHFYELGKQSRESVSEELEEAAEAGARQFYVAGGYSPFPNIECGAYKNGFIAGAEWQKEQILQLAKNRYEMAMTFVSGNPDVDQAIQLDRLGLVTIIQKKESR